MRAAGSIGLRYASVCADGGVLPIGHKKAEGSKKTLQGSEKIWLPARVEADEHFNA